MAAPTSRTLSGTSRMTARPARSTTGGGRREPESLEPDPPITRQQLLVTGGILTALSLAALDASVVGTAMPTIIGQLGGLAEYSWVFSGYLLASTTTVPLFSKLADMYGRRPIFLIGLLVFVAASVACGFSSSMFMLVGLRTIQGIGAGALQPVAFTIVGDIYTPAQRAKIQGLFSAVWGGTAIIGPAIGGIITTTIGWPWVFWINLPIGVAAFVVFTRVFHENFEKVRHRIDWIGMILLTLGVGSLLFALSEGSDLFGYTSPAFLALMVLSLLIIIAFITAERAAAEPLIDFKLLTIPVISGGLAIGSLVGVAMYGLTTYVPPFVQGVEGGSPVEAGAAVAAMSIGWPIGSMLGGRLMLRYGTRRIVVIGSALSVVGLALVTQLPTVAQLWYSMVATGLAGFGMGLGATTIMVSIQGSVAWNRRGVATGLVQFSRSIGGSIGIGLMGGILTAAVGTHSAAVLDPLARNNLSPADLASARAAIESGLSINFWIIFVAGVAAFLVAYRTMPQLNIRELRRGRPTETDAQVVEGAVEAGLALEGGVEFL
ncbi:MAG TPA: MDR family MFS transporter [Candidatus Saccharimonadales bacterium]|nr:MDR family MFS transporter [Candidatus Saccharimonadales bacterium]